MCSNEEYIKHINNINKKKIYNPNLNFTTNAKNIAKSMSIIGSLNLLIYIIFLFILQLYMSKNTGLFEGFRWYHHLIWISIILIQVIYVLYLIIFPKNVNSFVDATLYDIFTADVIDNRGSFKINRLFILIKNLFKAILLEPFIEYLFLILLVLIPWPFFKNISYLSRLNIILMKVGIFNIIISFVCLDYDNIYKYGAYRVNTTLDVPK
uniref:Uncharacterized protein n=1 Tax=viral metagenome TaxID=1070528 RepID=A0A6C0CYR0_9ZZZZ